MRRGNKRGDAAKKYWRKLSRDYAIQPRKGWTRAGELTYSNRLWLSDIVRLQVRAELCRILAEALIR